LRNISTMLPVELSNSSRLRATAILLCRVGSDDLCARAASVESRAETSH
jgi:hypothetical protein